MSEFDDQNAEHTQAAAQIESDRGVEHIADVYARALLGAAESAGFTQTVLDEFDALIVDVLGRFPKLDAIFASGLISPDQKIGVIDRVFGERFSATFIHFLKVVARHGRLDCLRAIHRRTGELLDELLGRVRVDVTTAAPFGDSLAESIKQNLHAALGAEPILEHSVDPQLIGGMVIRVGDTVYDGSVANQLKNLREKMIDRSVHEIQSRRDRFRYPAGD